MQKEYIDYLRTIAIIAVITIHITAEYYYKFGEINNINWWVANIANSSSRFAVPLFVMISGAVILGKEISVKQFYKKRASRLLPPFILWSLIYIGFDFFKGVDIDTMIWNLKIGYFSKGKTGGHLWYLSMFICLMLFAPFINQYINGIKPSTSDLLILIVVSFIFFIMNTISSMAQEIKGINIGWYKVFPWYISYFILGYYLDKISYKINFNKLFYFFILLIIIAIGSTANYLSIIYLNKILDSLILNNTGILVFLMSSVIFIYVKNNTSHASRAILILSHSSFEIYLIHPIFIYIIMNNVPKIYLIQIFSIPILIIATLLISLAAVVFLKKTTVKFRRI